MAEWRPEWLRALKGKDIAVMFGIVALIVIAGLLVVLAVEQ